MRDKIYFIPFMTSNYPQKPYYYKVAMQKAHGCKHGNFM